MVLIPFGLLRFQGIPTIKCLKSAPPSLKRQTLVFLQCGLQVLSGDLIHMDPKLGLLDLVRDWTSRVTLTLPPLEFAPELGPILMTPGPEKILIRSHC